MQPIKALTVQQPWAACIADGSKTVENRTKSTAYRGPLAIHAGRRWSKDGARDRRVRKLFEGYLMPYQIERGELDSTDLPDKFAFGAVIAVANLVECHRSAGCCEPWGEPDQEDGKPTWHWVLSNTMVLNPPIEATGRLGLWDLPALQVAAAMIGRPTP